MAEALPGGTVDGPWIHCPWCPGTVPLTHFVESDEEPGARVAVCDGCGRRVSFVPPEEPDDRTPPAAA
jgi:hypothetical protein